MVVGCITVKTQEPESFKNDGLGFQDKTHDSSNFKILYEILFFVYKYFVEVICEMCKKSVFYLKTGA